MITRCKRFLSARGFKLLCPAMLLAGVILLFYLLQASPPLSLIIENPGTKEVHYAIPCLPGDVFTLAYRHSVSKSMVYGTFALTQRGGIKPLTTSFSSFGPGLPWLDEGVEHTIADGKFTVQHDEEPREEIRLWVSPLTEDSISLNGVTYGLASLADEPVLLRIHVQVEPIVLVVLHLSPSENFLYMIRPDNQYSELEAEILDLNLILHAEHGGGNNSAFVTHVVSSTDTDTYSAIAAAIGSLKGTKHGGANIKVFNMVEDIKANVSRWDNEKEIEDYLVKIIRKNAFDRTGLVYGIGHAVYTLSDPRARLLREKARDLSREKGMAEEFNLYNLIENIAPLVIAEEKKIDKNMATNVDFYSGFVYKMLNIPVELFTPIFAMSRIAGWSAHRIEEIVSGGRVIRPAYKNVMPKSKYIPLSQR